MTTKRTLNAEGTAATPIRVNFGEVVIEAAGSSSDPMLRNFKLKGYTGGTVNLPGYDLKVVFDLRTMYKNPGQLPLLLDHRFDQPVGHSDNIAITEKKVSGSGWTSVPGVFRERVVDAADKGFRWQLSVGGVADTMTDVEFIPEGRSVAVNGRTLQGPLYLVKNYHLREISFVSMGADDEGAEATLVAALREKSSMNFADWLRSKGKDINKLTAQELATWRASFDAEMSAGSGATGSAGESGQSSGGTQNAGSAGSTAGAGGQSSGTGSASGAGATAGGATGGATSGATGGATLPVVIPDGTGNEFAERRAVEIERHAALETLNAQFGSPTIAIEGRTTPLLAHAVRQQWTPSQFELHCLRMNRPTVPQTQSRSEAERGILNAAFVGAFIQRAGIALDHRFFGSGLCREHLNAAFSADVNSPDRQRWMNAAQQYRSYSMVDMVRAVANNEGVVDLDSCGHWRSPKWMRAAFSSMAVVDLFTQSIQAVLLATYEENKFIGLENFVQMRDVPNFLLNERPRVQLGGNEFERLLPTGTAKEITMSSTGEAYKIGTYAAQIKINDETLINERFDVIEDQPKAMGIAGARIEPELFFALLLSNPNMKDGQPFFQTGLNRRTGSAATEANLEAAINTFALMKEGGQTINLEASHVLHAKSKRFTWAKLLAAAPMITGAAADRTSQNVFANIVDPVYDARLDNGFNSPEDRTVPIAGEAGSWWLGDKRFPAIEMGHLAGTNRSVQIDSGRMTEGQWGIWFAARKMCGVAPLRRESIQKNEA